MFILIRVSIPYHPLPVSHSFHSHLLHYPHKMLKRSINRANYTAKASFPPSLPFLSEKVKRETELFYRDPLSSSSSSSPSVPSSLHHFTHVCSRRWNKRIVNALHPYHIHKRAGPTFMPSSSWAFEEKWLEWDRKENRRIKEIKKKRNR